MPFDELGFYALAGGAKNPRAIVDEIRTAEQLGLGTAFISERFDVKEAATLCGAAGAVSDTIRIVTAATNQTTRHPMVTAAFASTMHGLTNGRFNLGLGRGIKPIFDAYGIAPITTKSMEEFAQLMRRLWSGEVVTDFQDSTRAYRVLAMDRPDKSPIGLTLVAFGPDTLALGGRCFDEVVLHTFFSDDTTAKAVQVVKAAAERAGRNPDDVKVWSCLATIGDHIEEGLRLKKTVGRLATYLQAYGDLMVRVNRWDPDVLTKFRADPFVSSFRGSIDSKATTPELEHVATLIPAEWFASSATGSPPQCVEAVRHQLGLGCDAVILHGATPIELGPVVHEYATTQSTTVTGDRI